MGTILNNLLNALHVTDEDDLDEDYEVYVNEMEEKVRRKEERQTQRQTVREPREVKSTAASQRASYRDEMESAVSQTAAAVNGGYSEVKRDRQQRTERLNNGKVVPLRTTAKGLEVCIMKPTTFEDSQDICDMLLSGRAAVINLEGFDVELAQRVMDFVSGSVYAMNGRLHQISSYIFIISPETVDISGDYLDIIRQDGFGVPTLNKGF